MSAMTVQWMLSVNHLVLCIQESLQHGRDLLSQS